MSPVVLRARTLRPGARRRRIRLAAFAVIVGAAPAALPAQTEQASQATQATEARSESRADSVSDLLKPVEEQRHALEEQPDQQGRAERRVEPAPARHELPLLIRDANGGSR